VTVTSSLITSGVGVLQAASNKASTAGTAIERYLGTCLMILLLSFVGSARC